MRLAYLALIEIDVANACLVHTREIAEGLAGLGHQVTLILPRPLRGQTWGGVEHAWVRWWGFDRKRQWAFVRELGTKTAHFSQGDRRRARADLGLPPDGEIILFAGSFHPHHDLSTLVKAFAQLAPRGFEKARLLLVGDGYQWGATREAIASLGIGGRVTMCGFRPYEEIPSYFQAADIGVVPLTASNIIRRNGAVTAKLWDYMAGGLAVVARDVPHCPIDSPVVY